MWGNRYWGNRFWGRRYWGKAGKTPDINPDDGSVTISPANTPTPLATRSQVCHLVMIQRKATNVGAAIYVGGPNVGVGDGLKLENDTVLTIRNVDNVFNLKSIYVNSATDGDVVNYFYGVR